MDAEVVWRDGLPSDEEIARTLELTAEGVADLARTIVRSPRSTIEPPARSRADSAGKKALEELGRLHRRASDRAPGEPTSVASGERGISAGLELGATIGEGGMGVVRAATQRSLGRKVAVKTLREETRSPQATLRLLREAWVTGSLEHPNIVPVYDLGLDEDGSPVIILKHIEGRAWSDLIHDADAMRAQLGTSGDLLEQNLRILTQLCNAVSLAHSRGVIHRDLKPENVMIGRFGEVYLVDWGIAVSLREDPTGRLPLASESREMAGTPAYMAPEMLGAMGTLEERTDVYLLGAILYEILAGRPPHAADGFRQMVASIVLSTPAFPDEAPQALVEIARRAMSRSAADRFASADALRHRLDWYLRHRGSLALSAEAQSRVAEMDRILAEGGEAKTLRDRINRLFAEARFGFRQAIRECDDNEAASAGLRRATEVVVEFELLQGTPEAAAAALAELESPPADLAERVAAAMRARDRERRRVAELERLGAAHDPQIGRRTRLASAAMLGVLWAIFPQVTGYLVRHHQAEPHWVHYAGTVGILLLCVLIGLWGRESLTKTIVNRRMIASVLVMFGVQLAFQVGAHLLGMPPSMLWVMLLFTWFVIVFTFAVLVDFRFWPTVLAFLVGFLVAAISPPWVFHAMTLVNLVLLANLTVAWSRPLDDGEHFVTRMRDRMDRRRQRR